MCLGVEKEISFDSVQPRISQTNLEYLHDALSYNNGLNLSISAFYDKKAKELYKFRKHCAKEECQVGGNVVFVFKDDKEGHMCHFSCL